MIAIADAQNLINSLAVPADTEELPLEQGCGRVLAEDIISPMSVPPFNRSPLDGFAFVAADTAGATKWQPARFTVDGVIGAGQVWQEPILPGHCLRIMTGAPVPQGADAVAAIEKVTVGNDEILIDMAYSSGENVALAGEDLKTGQTVLYAGVAIGAVETGILAALGRDAVRVYARPRVSVIATGSELVPVGSSLPQGKIYDSNSIMLSMLAREAGAALVSRKLAPDGLGDLTESLEKALENSDVVITTGGVSVGDYDLTREAVEATGAEVLFHRVAMKPGTPMLAATRNNKLLLCLSGNPAAAFVTFWVFVRPALLRMRGHAQWQQPYVKAIINHALEKKGRQNRFIRAMMCYSNGLPTVEVTGRERPGILSSLHEANALIYLPAVRGPLKAGDTVDVLPIGMVSTSSYEESRVHHG